MTLLLLAVGLVPRPASAQPALPAVTLPPVVITTNAPAGSPIDRVLQAMVREWRGGGRAVNGGDATMDLPTMQASFAATADADGSDLLLHPIGDINARGSRGVGPASRELPAVGLIGVRRSPGAAVGLGVFAPPNTPAPILAALRAEAERVKRSRTVLDALAANQYESGGAQTVSEFLAARERPRLVAVAAANAVHDKLSTIVAARLNLTREVSPDDAARDEQTALARGVRNQTPDGRVLMLAQAQPGMTALVTALQDLVPVADLGEHVDGNGSTYWHGLFAPAGTPADVVASLRTRIAAALAAPATSRELAGLGIRNINAMTLAARIESSLPRRVQQAAVTPRPPAPPAPAPPPNTNRTPPNGTNVATNTTRAALPTEAATGNLYFVLTCDPQVGDADCRLHMVSGVSEPDALTVATRVQRFRERLHERVTLVRECAGPIWGAIVHRFTSQGAVDYGYACDATPGEALRLASAACAREAATRGRGPCQYPEGHITDNQMQVHVGHSGTAVSAGTMQAVFHNWTTSRLWAFAGNFSGNSVPVFSGEDAASKLGKPCSAYAAGINITCFLTFRNFDCVNAAQGDTTRCVDYRYTAEGVEPYRAGETQPTVPGRPAP